MLNSPILDPKSSCDGCAHSIVCPPEDPFCSACPSGQVCQVCPCNCSRDLKIEDGVDTGRQAEVKLTKFLALRMCELIITTVLHLSTTGKRGLWRCAENGGLFCSFFTALGTFSHFMSLFYCQRIFKCSFMMLR